MSGLQTRVGFDSHARDVDFKHPVRISVAHSRPMSATIFHTTTLILQHKHTQTASDKREGGVLGGGHSLHSDYNVYRERARAFNIPYSVPFAHPKLSRCVCARCTNIHVHRWRLVGLSEMSRRRQISTVGEFWTQHSGWRLSSFAYEMCAIRDRAVYSCGQPIMNDAIYFSSSGLVNKDKFNQN